MTSFNEQSRIPAHMQRTPFLILMCAVQMGCATHPDAIHPSYTSPYKYRQYDCGQLLSERESVEKEATKLHGYLRRAANSDVAQVVVGLAFFWPALLLTDAPDSAQSVKFARLKGDHEALLIVIKDKGCLPQDQMTGESNP